MAWVAVGVAAVSVISSIMGEQAKVAEADRKRAVEMYGAKVDYSMTENNINIMKAQARENTNNATFEALRAGAGKSRELQLQIKQGLSKVQSRNEGLTSGRSKGRQIIATQIEAGKMLLDNKSETMSVINRLVDGRDKQTEELNNKLMNSYMQMATVLTIPGATAYKSNPMDTVSAGLSGYSAG